MGNNASAGKEIELVIGQKYYRCYVDYAVSPPEPIVETLVYLGYEECECTCEECEKPYHFHKFTMFRQFYPSVLAPSQLILAPSRKQLDRYYTFPEFITNLRVLMIALRESEGIILPKHFELLQNDLDNKEVGTDQPTPPKNE